MPCDELKWNTGPIPDDMKLVLALNIFKEYEIGVNTGSRKVNFEPVGDGLYRKVVVYVPDWNGIYDMGLIAAWAELPAPDIFIEKHTSIAERLHALQIERP
jgi:hypothetical protein